MASTPAPSVPNLMSIVMVQGDWTRMANLYGDVWEISNFGGAPLSLRITDNYGVTLLAP